MSFSTFLSRVGSASKFDFATTIRIWAHISMLQATARRISKLKECKARAAIQPLARSVLRDDVIRFADRAKILAVLGLSMATFNVGIWHNLSRTTLRAWTVAITAMYRCLLAEDRLSGHPAHPDAEAVAGATGLPFATTLLIRERLLHWSRIALGDPGDRSTCVLRKLARSDYTGPPVCAILV